MVAEVFKIKRVTKVSKKKPAKRSKKKPTKSQQLEVAIANQPPRKRIRPENDGDSTQLAARPQQEDVAMGSLSGHDAKTYQTHCVQTYSSSVTSLPEKNKENFDLLSTMTLAHTEQ